MASVKMKIVICSEAEYESAIRDGMIRGAELVREACFQLVSGMSSDREIATMIFPNACCDSCGQCKQWGCVTYLGGLYCYSCALYNGIDVSEFVRAFNRAHKYEAPEPKPEPKIEGCNGRCPRCDAPAYVSLLFIECSRGKECNTRL